MILNLGYMTPSSRALKKISTMGPTPKESDLDDSEWGLGISLLY